MFFMNTKTKNHIILILHPSEDDAEALNKTLQAYKSAIGILEQTTGSNLVALHEEVYEKIRKEIGLPSRMVTLAIRDHAKKRQIKEIHDIPIDSKIFSIKGTDEISISTILGRKIIPYTVAGYHSGFIDFAEARIIFSNNSIKIFAKIKADILNNQEPYMSHQGILSRLGRIIAGSISSSIDAVEASNPAGTAMQAIREIDKIADEARAELGSALLLSYLQNKL